jgi:hypothetical protein
MALRAGNEVERIMVGDEGCGWSTILQRDFEPLAGSAMSNADKYSHWNAYMISSVI